MNIYARSDIGLVRESNQDVVNYKCLDDNFLWVLVCDGMGGQNSGEMASKLTSEVVENLIKNEYNEKFDEEDIKNLLFKCLKDANAEVFNKSEKEPSCRGMGTTAVLAIVKDETIFIAHVGDSRAYLISNEVEQLTTDHSMVQEMVNNGEINEKEALVHPKRNIITRAIGIQPEVEIDYIKKNFVKNSSLLICTDGCSNYMDEKTILEYFSNYNGKVLVDKLIEHCNNIGGKDNITAAVVSH